MTPGVLATGADLAGPGVFAGPLMDVVAAGWDPAFKDLTASLVRMMLITPAIFAVSGFGASVLNSFQRFVLAALAPIMYNLAIIVSAFFLANRRHRGLAIGAVGRLGAAPADPGARADRRSGCAAAGLSLGHAGVREVGRLMGRG